MYQILRLLNLKQISKLLLLIKIISNIIIYIENQTAK